MLNRRCRLGPLGLDDLKRLVAATLSVPDAAVPEALVSVVSSMSAGHPMLVKEARARQSRLGSGLLLPLCCTSYFSCSSLLFLTTWASVVWPERCPARLFLPSAPAPGKTQIVVMLTREGKLRVDAAAGTCEMLGGKDDIQKGALAPGQNAIARMQMLVQHRLDGFGMAARSALRVAAAIRGKFDLPFLRRCCAEITSDTEAQSIASELLEEGVWAMIPETPVHYQFAHDLVRSLVYQSIPPDQRRQIHAAILYECVSPRPARPRPARLLSPALLSPSWLRHASPFCESRP